MASRPGARRLLRLLRRVAAVLGVIWLALTVLAAAYDVTSSGTVSVPKPDAYAHDVRTGAVTTHYEQWGTGGSPVVLVHGFLESSYVWQRLGPRLAARGHRVYALDVRGFGYSERRGPYTLAGDTAQLAAFLTALRLNGTDGPRPLLVGHSSGAAIVANLALQHPEAASRIVLLDGDGTPYGVGPGWVHRLFVNPYATAVVRLATRHPSLAAQVYRSACGPGCPPFDAAAWTTPFRVPGGEAALIAVLRQPLIGLTYAQEAGLRTPASVVYGSRDPEMSARDAKDTAVRLHTTDVVEVPGAPHLVMLAAPDALAEVLAQRAAG